MKNTINIEKIQNADNELLEKMACAVLKEMNRRSFLVYEKLADRPDQGGQESAQVYKQRYQETLLALDTLEKMPKRIKWAE